MKISKRTGALGLTAALVLTGALPVMGANQATALSPVIASPSSAPSMDAKQNQGENSTAKAKISKEAAIKLATSLVSIPADYKLTSSRYDPAVWQTDNGVWFFNYQRVVKERYSYISVSIDAETGKLVSFSLDENDPDKKITYPPKVDLAKAKELAAEQLKKLSPTDAAKVKYDDQYDEQFRIPLQGKVNYTLQFNRMVDSVPYSGDGITVTIDGDGQLVGYNYRWHDSRQFASAVPTVKPDQAEAVYKNKNKPYLQYIVVSPPGGKAEVVLTYQLQPNPLDAKSGELIVPFHSVNPTTLKPLTDKPLAAKPSSSKELTEDQAVAIAKKFITLPAGAVLQNAGYSEYEDTAGVNGSRSAWDITWRVGKENDKDTKVYRASVNAKTGEFVNYSYDDSQIWKPLTEAQQKTRLTSEKAQKVAEDYLKKVLPHYSHELVVVPAANNLKFSSDNNSRTVNVELRRLVNGIATENDSVNVTVDVLKGTVTNYYSNISAYTYPAAPGNMIDSAKAQELLLAPYKFALEYYDREATPEMVTDNAAKKTAEPAALVYNLKASYDESVFLDAATGNWRKRDTGEVTVPGKVVATDIAGHAAQRELQLMLDYRALDVKDGKVNPDQVITRGEFIKMLVITVNGGNFNPMYAAGRANSFKDVAQSSALFGYVESAVDAGILDPTTEVLKPEAKMNREEMAQLLVRALGFDKLAGQTDLFKLDANDSDQIKLKGQVAIALSLGIMDKSSGSFQPQNDVSRAEAAISFFRFLEVRPTMQSAPTFNNYLR